MSLLKSSWERRFRQEDPTVNAPALDSTRMLSVPSIEWREPDGYAGWLKANMGLERIATSDHAVKVIQGLLAMRRRSDGD